MKKLQSFLRYSVHFSPSRRHATTGVALIAGAGPGIGFALARKFASEGMSVCVVRRNENKLEHLVREIRENNGKCEAFGCDIRKENDVITLVEDIETKLGPIELAVHNIGANIGYISVKDTTVRKYSKVWEMAALSAFLVGREVATRMEQRERGTIIFTGATASMRGSAGHCAFSGGCMAKRAFAQSMAREFGPKGIHVAHVILDGAVDNPNTRSFFGGDELFDKMAAVDGLLRPDDAAVNYWHLHSQPRSVWTHEIDLRPWNEKW